MNNKAQEKIDQSQLPVDAMGADIAKKVGHAVRQFRLALGITPEELAEDIGSSSSFVLKLEAGSIDADIRTLEKCANALCTDISELLLAATSNSEPVMVSLECEQPKKIKS